MRLAATISGACLVSATAAAQSPPRTAHVDLTNSMGTVVGTATLTETAGGVLIQVRAAGLPPGRHACHVHEAGHCDGPGFTTAGGHFNPDGRAHGFLRADGPHAGDLPNLLVAADGQIDADLFSAALTLGNGRYSLLRPGGTALVIHAKPDDYQSQPAGNAGERLVCGVIVAP